MKKIVALALAVIMTMTMFCALAVTSSAADDVKYDASTKIVVADNGDGTSNVKVYFYDESELGIIGSWLEITLSNVKPVEGDAGDCCVQPLYNYLAVFEAEWPIESKITNVKRVRYQKQADYEYLDENTINIMVCWHSKDTVLPFSLNTDVLDMAYEDDICYDYDVDMADYLEEDGSLLIAEFNIVNPEDGEEASIHVHPINYSTGNFTVNTELPMTAKGKRHGVGYWDKYEFKAEVEPPVVPAEVKVAGTSVRYTNPQGLRFVAEITANDQVVEGAGMIITAADSDKSLDVPAMLYLDEACTTYSAVLANIKATNYSRTFTATPYVVVDGEKVLGTAGSASAHDVAVEILANDPDFGHEDRPDYATVAKALLNLYAAG